MTTHQLTAPDLKNYPFINIVFQGDRTRFITDKAHCVLAGEDGKDDIYEDVCMAGDPERRTKINSSQFRSAADITDTLLAPYCAMTDETFASLASILGIKCDDADIRERSSLEYFTYKNSSYHLPNDEGRQPYIQAQLEAYFLARATFSKSVHWGNLVSLFNQSADDQQQAIRQYFETYHGLELESLLAHKAKDLTIPDCLIEPFESRSHKGNEYRYSQVLQKWLRDDAYQQQYRFDIVNPVTRTLIATAPTLAQILAKATAYLKDNEYPIDTDYCDILQGGRIVAWATLESINSSDDRLLDWASRPVKPLWVQYEPGAEIEAVTKYTTPLKKNEFIKTLFAVEKALGVQWNKVRHMEEALGI